MHLRWKQQHAIKLGVALYHIFDDDWRYKQSIIKSMIAHILGVSNNRKFARKCGVRKIGEREKNVFLEMNHIQGPDESQIMYGLFDNEELLAVMTFKIDRGQIEFSRFAVKIDHSIPGAASKLFNFFLKEHDPKNVITYADQCWNGGSLYKALGFRFKSISTPNYWYLENYSKRINPSTVTMGLLYNEQEFMRNKGYDRIWDCGTAMYIWND